MIKRLLYIFIPVLAVLLMSHNVSAINLNFENYSVRDSFATSALNCNVNLSITSSGNAFCSFNAPSSVTPYLLKTIQLNNTYRLYKGEIVEFYYVIYNNQLYNTDGVIFLNDVQNISTNIITLNYELVDDYKQFELGSNSDHSELLDVDVISNFWIDNRIAKVYRITQYVKEDGLYYIGFGTNSSSTTRFVTNWYQLQDGSLRFSLRNFVIYSPEDTKVNKEQAEVTQDAADNSSTAGDSSTSDSTSATSSLLSVIGSGIGAITSATPSNCKINGNMGNLNMGQIDLCANPVPTFVAVIGSFIAVALVLPLVIILFNRFISIIRSFQS